MEIIKHGKDSNVEKARNPIVFICPECGCEFKAYKDEYKYGGKTGNVDKMVERYYVKCPDCKNIIGVMFDSNMKQILKEDDSSEGN